MGEKSEKIEKILEIYTNDKSNLIQILNEIQETFGYIPKIALNSISKYLSVPISEINGIIAFNSRLTLEKKGKYIITVCLGNSCFANRSQKILNRLKEKLQIDVGNTTADEKFSLETRICLGKCAHAPVIKVNDKIYEKVTLELVDKIIEEYKNK